MSKEQVSYNYSTSEVLKKEMEIHDLTLESIDKELPDAEAKSLAFTKLIAAVEYDLYEKVKRVNKLVDEIKAFHETRLAETGTIVELNAALTTYKTYIFIDEGITLNNLNLSTYHPNDSSYARDYLDNQLNKAAWFSNIADASSITGFTQTQTNNSIGVYDPKYSANKSYSYRVTEECNIVLNEEDHWDGETYELKYVEKEDGTYKPSADGGVPSLQNVPKLVCPPEHIPNGAGVITINKINIKIYGYDLKGENPVEVKESDLNEDTVGIGTFNVLQNIKNTYDVGINTNNSVSFTYDGQTFSGNITEGSTNYNNYLKPKFDEISTLRSEINDLMSDINKMKDMRKKSDLYTWSLKFSKKDTKEEKERRKETIGTFDKFQEKYKDNLGFPEPQNNEVTRGNTFKELTEKEKRQLSETYGLGIPKNIKIKVGEDNQPLRNPETGEKLYFTDEGFNQNYDEKKLKKFVKDNPGLTAFRDLTVTESGSIIVIDSVGTATTSTGISTQVNTVTSGAMNDDNVGAGASITDQGLDTTVGYSTSNVLPSPASEVGLAVTYSGSIGVATLAWQEGYFDEVVANTFTGAATSVRASAINNTLNQDLPLIIGVGASLTGRADIQPVVNSDITYNPSTGELRVGLISASQITGVVGASTQTNVNDGNSNTDGVLLFTNSIANNQDVFGDSGIRVNPSNNEIIAGRFTGIVSATDVTISGVSTFTGAIDANGDLDVDGHTELDNVNVSGVSTFVGTADFNGDLDVDGHTELDNVNVSGVSTFVGTADFNGDLDVDGHTELDNLNVSGVSTFVGAIDANGDLDVDGHTELDNVNVSGVSTFTGAIDANGDLDVAGTTKTEQLNVSGVSTFTGAIDANGDLDVDGHTELDNVNVSGVSTFAGAIDANGDLDVDGHTELDDVNVSGVSTFAGAADFNGNVDIDGHTELDDVNVSGAITATTFSGDLTGNAGTATALETARTFEVTGDVVASAISFDGTGNVSLAATIQPNSVELSTDTTGDYVESVSGTANEIVVTGGTGEGSTPTISFATNPTIGGDVTVGQDLNVTRDLQVTRNLNVDGNVGIGTTNPQHKLHVEGDINYNNNAIIANNSGSSNIDHFWHNDAPAYGQGGVWNFVSDGTYKANGSSAIRAGAFANMDDTGTSSQKLQITGGAYISGNLGIGVTNPGAKLVLPITSSYGSDTLQLGTSNSWASNAEEIYTIGFGDPITTQMGIGMYGSTRSIWNRYGLAVHVKSDSEFSIKSTDWNNLFSVQGGTGNVYVQGNVGIGTDNPTTPLHILSASTGLKVQRGTESFSVNANYGGQSHCAFEFTNAFSIRTGTGSQNERLRITSGGDVGIGVTNPGAKLEVNVGSAVTAFDIQGSEGQLFSVTNNLTSGSIFSVNDVSGIPSIDVDADGTIQLAPYSSTENVGVGTTNPTAKLDVRGTLNVSGVSTFTGAIDANGDLDVDGHTELDNVNVSGVSTFVGTVDFNGDLDVDGHTELDNVNVSGVSTFTGAIDANGGLDVDGHTELDDVNISGVSTFAGAIDANGDLDVDGHTELDDVNISGVSTFAGAIDANGDLDVDGHTELDDLNVSGVSTFVGTADFNGDINVDGHTELDDLNVSGVSTFVGTVDFNGDLDVDGHTELDNVNVSGVSTFTGTADFNGDIDVDGHTELDDLNVSGVSTFTGAIDANGDLDVDGHTELDDLNVSGVSTFTGAIDANGDLDVDGHTELDNLNVSGASTFTNTVHIENYNRLKFGLSSDTPDLEIYHGSNRNSFIDNNTKSLIIRNNVDNDGSRGNILIQANAGEQSAIFNDNGAVELYYDNSKKFETTGIGVSVLNGSSDTATIAGPSNLIIDPGVVGDNTGIVQIKGDLIVDGTTTTINSDILDISNFVIGIASTATTDILADGSGLEFGPSDNSFKYFYNSGIDPSFKSSENINVASGKGYQVNQVEVLNATTLGSSVVNSSLINLGTLTALTVSGAIDANGDLDVDGHTELDDLNVSGVSTFTGAIDANGDLDVDGHTELDDLNVSGVSTFTGAIDANGDLDVDGHTELDDLNVSGVSTFVGTADFNGDLDVDGHTELDDLNVSGVSTFVGAIDANGDLDVDGHTELDDLNVSGVSTFTGNVTIEDSELKVGDVSGDSYVLIKQVLSDDYGFDWQHNNASVFINEQGTTNQALVLGDVDANNSYSGLFGISHTSDGGSNWAKKLDLRGDGDLYIGSSAQNRVLTTADEGTGNGLDADQVDGLDASQFLRSDADDVTTGQIQITRANSTTTGGGQIYLNGANGNRIDWVNTGVDAPTFATRSIGTKLVLFPAISSEKVDFALGIETSTLWYSVPNTSKTHRWYGGTTSMMSLTNSNLDVVGTITGSRLISDVAQGTAPLTVTSTTLVSNLNADQVDGLDASQFLRSDADDDAQGFGSRANVNSTGDPGLLITNGSRLGFDQTGTRSWTIKASGGNLNVASGDGSGTLTGQINADTLDGLDSTQFLRSDASDTTTGNLTISKTSPKLILSDTNITTGSYPAIQFDTNNNQGVLLEHNEFDSELPVAGYGLVLRESPNNTEFPTTGTLTFNVLGDIYAGNTSLGSLYRVLTTADEGSGNGLDADTVDGIEASSFLRSDANDTFTGNLSNNGDNYITFGPNSTWSRYLRIGGNGYQGNSTTANVATTNGNLHIDAATSSGTYLNYYAGTAGVAFGSGAGAVVAVMGPDGDLWKGNADNSGSKYWHAGNHGDGSGLDADKLDGQQGTYYLNTSATTQTKSGGLNVIGNVGIGTNNPTEKLSVYGGIIRNDITAAGTSLILNGGGTNLQIRHTNGNTDFYNSGGAFSFSTATYSDVLKLASNGAVTIGSRTSTNPQGNLTIARGEALGGGTGPIVNIVHGPDGGTQRTHQIYSYIGDLRIVADSNENMELHTGGSLSQIITSGGNIGIGTDNPAQKLDVIGGNIRVGKTSNGKYIAENSSGLSKVVIDSSGVSYFNGGNVGIGTDNPANLLHVYGQSRFEDYVRGNSNSSILYILDNVAISATKKLYFDTGSNTYIDEVSADTLRFTTGGAERLRISSDGKLSVTGSTGNMEYLRMGGNNDRGLRFSSSSGSSSVGVVHTINAPGDSGAQGEIVLQTNSTERLRITSDGSVAIGTTIPGTKLDVNDGSANCTIRARTGIGFSSFLNLLPNGSGSGISLAANSDSSAQLFNQLNSYLAFGTNNTERLRIDSNGRLLLRSGTTESTDRVGGFHNALQVEGTSATSSSVAIIRNSNDVNSPYLNFGKSRGTSVGSNTIVNSNDTLAIIDFTGSDGSGSFNSHASIRAFVDGTPGDGDSPGKISFWTTPDNSSTPAERLIIKSGGNVGINSTSPETTLDIVSDTGIFIKSATNNPTNGARIQFSDILGGSQKGHIIYKHADNSIAPGSNDGFLIGGTETLSVVRIEGRAIVDEKVGIGTDNPLQKLHIVDDTSANIYLETKNPSTGSTSGIYFRTSDSSTQDAFFKTAIVLEDDGTTFARGKLHILQENTADDSNATLSDSVVTIDQSGNVGIGTNNPSAKLDVRGTLGISNTTDTSVRTTITSSPTGLIVNHNDNSSTIFQNQGAERVRIDSSGNVGIGTNDPQEKLHVLGTSDFVVDTDAAGLRFGSYGEHDIALVTGRNTPSGSSRLYIENGNGEALRITSDGKIGIGETSPSSKFEIVSGDTATIVSGISLKNDSTSASGPGSSIDFVVDGVNDVTTAQIIGQRTSANYHQGSLQFRTRDSDGGGLLERLRITADGDVGIGVTNPGAKLEVNVGSAVTAFDIQGSAGQLFSVTNNLTSGSIFAVNDVSGIPSIDVDADGTIQLAPYSSTENVGVGTTNPQAKLDVNGTLNVSGVSTFQGNVNLGDNDRLILGTGEDLQIYHDGSNNYIQGISGNLILKNNTSDYFVGNNSSGSVELNYNNSKKFETTSNGATITGTLGVSTINSATINNSGLLDSEYINVGVITSNVGVTTSGYIEQLSVEEQIFTTDGNTDVNSTFDRITISVDAQGRTFADSDKVQYIAGSPGIGGLTDGQVYYVQTVGIDAIKLYTEPGLVNLVQITPSGSDGLHTFRKTEVGIGTIEKFYSTSSVIKDVNVTGVATVAFSTTTDAFIGVVTTTSITIGSPGSTYLMPTTDGNQHQVLSTDGSGTVSFINPDKFGGNRIYVSASLGNDSNDGKTAPVKTIKKAAQLASAESFVYPVTIMVAGGDYAEDNPIILADDVAVVGDNLRRVIVRPQNRLRDCFRVRNGNYITGIVFKDNIEFPTGAGVRHGILDQAGIYAKALVNQETGSVTNYRSITPTTNAVVASASTLGVTNRINELITLTKDSITNESTIVPTESDGNSDQEFTDAATLIIDNVGASVSDADTAYIPGNAVGWSTSASGGNYTLSDTEITNFEKDIHNVMLGIADDLRYGGTSGNEYTLQKIRNIVVGTPSKAFDYVISFDDPLDTSTSRDGYVGLSSDKPRITQSPYIQNCSIISFLGANGANVDGSKIIQENEPLVGQEAENPFVGDIPDQGKSMVANAFTAVSFGGIGWKVSNAGYAQIVSCFQIFCSIGSYAQSGGYLSITNSATNFGLYALRSTGFRAQAFDFDKGFIFSDGTSGVNQTLKVGGLQRDEQDLYVLRFINLTNGLDQTSNFKQAGITTSLSSSGINTITDTIDITGVTNSLADADGLLYIAPSNENQIGGLINDTVYYIDKVGAGTSANLYFDDELRNQVNLIDVPAGIHTFTKVAEEFFVSEIIEKNNIYQNLTLSDSIGIGVTFVPGTSITQTRSDDAIAVGFAVTWTSTVLTVSIENSVNSTGGTERLLFQTTSTASAGSGNGKITDENGTETSVNSVASRTDLYTINFKVDSTISGNSIQSIASLPKSYKCHLHRPSIVNSSAHTWEYAGSGIDYNALPQNGGTGNADLEQYNESGGRVFSSGTNELGDFKIGDSITAFNRTGNIEFKNKVTIGQLDSLELSLSGGIKITEISASKQLGENELGGPLDSRLSTQAAIRGYLVNRLGSFIDQNKSTSAIPSAVPQLNSQGLLDPGMIPAQIRFNNVFDTNVSGARTDLVNDIPAIEILKSDIVTEEFVGAGDTFVTTNNYTLTFENESQFLILSSDTQNYAFNNGDEVIASQNNAVGIVTIPTHPSYGTTGLVKGVINSITLTNGGSGYGAAGIYSGVNLVSLTGSGTSATADVTVDALGEVESVNIRKGGRYYASGDTFRVNASDIGNNSGTEFTATVDNVDTRLYVKLTGEKQQFFASTNVPDFISDGTVASASTDFSTVYTETILPTSVGVGGSIFFAENSILLNPNTLDFDNGDPVLYTVSGGVVIGQLENNKTYFVKRVGVSSIQLSESYDGSVIIPLDSSGTGTHKLKRLGVSTITDFVVFKDHGFTTGQSVKYTTNDGPSGIDTGSYYFVGSVTTNGFTLHDVRQDALNSINGSTINARDLTTIGSGIGTFDIQNVTFVNTVNTSSNNIDNFSILVSSADIDASNIISGTINLDRLATEGTPSNTTFLRGDQKWETAVQKITVGVGTTSALIVTGSTPSGEIAGTGINTYYGNLRLDVQGITTAGVGVDEYSKIGVVKLRFKQGSDVGPFRVTNSGHLVDLETTSAGNNNNGIDAYSFQGQSLATIVDLSSSTVNGNPRNVLPSTNGGTGINNSSSSNQGKVLFCDTIDGGVAVFGASANPTIDGTLGVGYFDSNPDNTKGTLDINQVASHDTSTTTTTAITQTSIFSFDKSTFRTGKFIISVTDNNSNEYHSTEMLVIHDGTNAFKTEYGSIFTSQLATFAVDVSGSNVRVLATPASTNSTTFKVYASGLIRV